MGLLSESSGADWNSCLEGCGEAGRGGGTTTGTKVDKGPAESDSMNNSTMIENRISLALLGEYNINTTSQNPELQKHITIPKLSTAWRAECTGQYQFVSLVYLSVFWDFASWFCFVSVDFVSLVLISYFGAALVISLRSPPCVVTPRRPLALRKPICTLQQGLHVGVGTPPVLP
jgi:hypothetical protein